MVISQYRGTSTVDISGFPFVLDRFQVWESTSATSCTGQQSSTAPTGFTNSLLVTVGTGGSATSTQQAWIRTKIEGYNIGDLAFGSVSAKTITLSFWVRSSLTGTYCVALKNSAQDRSYVSTYTISSANTWEQKTITVAGDQTGTWLTDNGIGIELDFDLGSGSSYNTTANVWQAGNYLNTSSQANLIGTSGATFYITGVQLEVGTQATTFDYRSYGTELALCQRYLPAWSYTGSGNQTVTNAFMQSTTNMVSNHSFPVTARTAPTGVTVVSGSGSLATSYTFNGPGGNITAANFYYGSTSAATVSWVSTGLTQYAGTQLYCVYAGSYLYFTGCEL
jgi:hypothetical protein